MKKSIFFYSILLIFLFGIAHKAYTQVEILDYSNSKEYTIRSISVESPSIHIIESYVINSSGLFIGQKIRLPGVEVSNAIKKLQILKIFTNIKIYQTAIEDSLVDLVIYLEETPRISGKLIKGLKKSESVKINELISTEMKQGLFITEYLLENTEYKIKHYFEEKGYSDVQVIFEVTRDTTKQEALFGGFLVTITIDKKEKEKVARIIVEGNHHVHLTHIRQSLKESMYEKSRFDVLNDLGDLLKGKKKGKQVDSMILKDGFYESAYEYFRNAIRLNLFTTSKYNKNELTKSKQAVLDLFNSKGYRDTKFIQDSIYRVENNIYANFKIEEGRKYYFRNITWVGNKKFRSGTLDTVLDIHKGDEYNQSKLNAALHYNSNGFDITSLYQDNGYLFFAVQPVEVKIVNDSVDLEIRIFEGRQPRIGRINVYGNTKTSDVVVLREIQIHPGDLFSKSAIIQSQQFLSQLGIFITKDIEVKPRPNKIDGTVDLDFYVKEAPADQVFLSSGWGVDQLVGTLTFQFNNFSLRNIFKRKSWTPLPSGDAQKLSINAQTNGKYYQNIGFSFTEPWLGGKKPISFGVSFNHSAMDYISLGSYKLTATNAGITIGSRMKWPDMLFQSSITLLYQRFDVSNYALFPNSPQKFTGVSNNIALTAQIQRNSTNDLIFPTQGSIFSASVEATLPYSYLSEGMKPESLQEKYLWMEYHKWKLKGQWFIPLDQEVNSNKSSRFVMMIRGEMGFLGYYNSNIGVTPFKRFFLGGDGLTGYYIDGREIIACRGYQNFALTPGFTGGMASAVGGGIYAKYTMELRYLIMPNPQCKIFGLAFLEAGNAWQDVRDFQPFKLNRSVGFGIRIYLPMFGLLGVDYGYGFDPIPGIDESARQKGVFHFMIGQQF